MDNVQSTAWDEASNKLKAGIKAMPAGKESKIRDIIGEITWKPLERTTRHRFGKYVRANLDHYGLVFVRKAGTIAVYKKSPI